MGHAGARQKRDVDNDPNQLVTMKNSRGFTLVEAALTMVLLMALVGVASVLMGRGAESYLLIVSRTEGVDQARYALFKMQQEISQLNTVTNVSAAGNLFEFTDSNGVKVDFHQEGTTIYRRYAGAAASTGIAQNISSLVFTCYNVDNDRVDDPEPAHETLNPAAVRRVRIKVVFTDPTGDPGRAGTYTLQTSVFPRIFLYANFKQQ